MCDSGVSMGFDILKAVENENEKLFLKHFNIYLPKWLGVSEKMAPIVFEVNCQNPNSTKTQLN